MVLSLSLFSLCLSLSLSLSLSVSLSVCLSVCLSVSLSLPKGYNSWHKRVQLRSSHLKATWKLTESPWPSPEWSRSGLASSNVNVISPLLAHARSAFPWGLGGVGSTTRRCEESRCRCTVRPYRHSGHRWRQTGRFTTALILWFRFRICAVFKVVHFPRKRLYTDRNTPPVVVPWQTLTTSAGEVLNIIHQTTSFGESWGRGGGSTQLN